MNVCNSAGHKVARLSTDAAYIIADKLRQSFTVRYKYIIIMTSQVLALV